MAINPTLRFTLLGNTRLVWRFAGVLLVVTLLVAIAIYSSGIIYYTISEAINAIEQDDQT
jgi:hypothetical protein